MNYWIKKCSTDNWSQTSTPYSLETDRCVHLLKLESNVYTQHRPCTKTTELWLVTLHVIHMDSSGSWPAVKCTWPFASVKYLSMQSSSQSKNVFIDMWMQSFFYFALQVHNVNVWMLVFCINAILYCEVLILLSERWKCILKLLQKRNSMTTNFISFPRLKRCV